MVYGFLGKVARNLDPRNDVVLVNESYSMPKYSPEGVFAALKPTYRGAIVGGILGAGVAKMFDLDTFSTLQTGAFYGALADNIQYFIRCKFYKLF